MKNIEVNSIEKFFLSTLLGVSIVGNILSLVADVLINPSDALAIPSDIAFSIALGTAYFIRNKYPTPSVLIITFIALFTVLYQAFQVPSSTITSLAIILIIGFVISVMLKGWVLWFMHLLTFTSFSVLFVFQFLTPSLRFQAEKNDTISLAITYSILYFILTYASAVLKYRYDKNNQQVTELNKELQARTDEIVAQNEELLQIQDHLNELNISLERKVIERTAKIQLQNETLIKYSYANAHHLRGPVARLLGLANVYDLGVIKDPDFFVHKMKEEALNIDLVIKQINSDLSKASED